MGQARFCPSRLLSLTPLFVLRQKPRPALALQASSLSCCLAPKGQTSAGKKRQRRRKNALKVESPESSALPLGCAYVLVWY